MTQLLEASTDKSRVTPSQMIRAARIRALILAAVIALWWGLGYGFSMVAWPYWVGTIGFLIAQPWLGQAYVRYLKAPFMLHRSFRPPVSKHFVRFDVHDADVLPEARATIMENLDAITSLGFTSHGHFRADSVVIGAATAYVSLLVNTRNGDEARLLTTHAYSEKQLPNGLILDSSKISTLTVFTRRFVDGTKVVTANSQSGGNFRRNRNASSLNYPDIGDPALLYRIHRRAAEELGSLSQVQSPRINDPGAHLAETAKEEWQRQLDGGEVFVNEADRTYRATWKGAVLMALRLQWPWRHLRRWSLHRRSQRFLRRFPELLEPSQTAG